MPDGVVQSITITSKLVTAVSRRAAPWKPSVRVATTADGILATAYDNGSTVDGVTLATGDRILLKDQSSGAENGIYTVNASGSPTRTEDADTTGELQGAAVLVRAGTTNSGKIFKLDTDPVTVGTTAQVWTESAGVALPLGWDDIALLGTLPPTTPAGGDYVLVEQGGGFARTTVANLVGVTDLSDYARLSKANVFTAPPEFQGGIYVGTSKQGGMGIGGEIVTSGNISSTGIVTGNTLVGGGAGITALNASNLSSGTIPDARLPGDLAALEALTGTSTIYYRSAADTWTAVTIGSGLTFTSGTLNTAGSGVADADYGDVTVSSSGTVWAIDNNTVTYAKMQDVGGAARLIGRGSSGSGDPQEITLGTGLSMSTTTLNVAPPYSSLTSLPAAIDAIDGLTPAADRVAYYTSGSAAALATLTTFGRSLIDDADAAAGRSTLGLGTAATQATGTSGANVPLLNGTNTWSGTQTISTLKVSGLTSGRMVFASTGGQLADQSGLEFDGMYLFAPVYSGNGSQLTSLNAAQVGVTSLTAASSAADADELFTYNASAAANRKLTVGNLRKLATPPGTIVPYGGTSAPSGWLECDGSAVSRTTYGDLYAAVATNFGSGNGTTTFNLPDFRRRTTVGRGGTAVGSLSTTVGSTGGAEQHTLSTGELPAHAHTLQRSDSEASGYGLTNSSPGFTNRVPVGTSGANTVTTANAGSGTAHNNLQPSLVVMFLIKT